MHWCSFFGAAAREWKISSQRECMSHRRKLYHGYHDAFISLKMLGSVFILSFQWNVWSNVGGDGLQDICESAVSNTMLFLYLNTHSDTSGNSVEIISCLILFCGHVKGCIQFFLCLHRCRLQATYAYFLYILKYICVYFVKIITR